MSRMIAVYVNAKERSWIEAKQKLGAKLSSYIRSLIEKDMESKAKPDGTAK